MINIHAFITRNEFVRTVKICGSREVAISFLKENCTQVTDVPYIVSYGSDEIQSAEFYRDHRYEVNSVWKECQ